MLRADHQGLGESHPPVSHGGHLAGVAQHRLATVGEGEVSSESGLHRDMQVKPAFEDAKAAGDPSLASVAGKASIMRTASFDR